MFCVRLVVQVWLFCFGFLIITLGKTCSQTFPRQMNNTLLQHHHILYIIVKCNLPKLSLMYFTESECRKLLFFLYSTNLAFQKYVFHIQIKYMSFTANSKVSVTFLHLTWQSCFDHLQKISIAKTKSSLIFEVELYSSIVFLEPETLTWH